MCYNLVVHQNHHLKDGRIVTKRLMLTVLLCVSLFLSACGVVETAVSVTNMTESLNQLNELVEQGAAADVAEARTIVEDLQAEWANISDTVQEQSAELHTQAQEALGNLSSAVNAEQLEAAVVDGAIKQLQEALTGIASF